MPPPYRRQLLAHLGLVAGMCDALRIGAVIAQATQQHPETRMVTVGHAVKAMVLNGWGVVHQPLYRVPRFFHFQDKPTHRLMAPGMEAPPLHEDTLGRAWETRDDDGVTALDRRMALTAAARLGLPPTCAPLDRTSVHVDGRDNSAEAPEAQVMHLTRGDSRDHRPDLNQVRLDVIVAQPAGIPLLMTPRSGHTRDTRACGPVVTHPMAQLQATDGTTSLVADSALDRAANLQQRAPTRRTGITRVPATFTAAHAALAHAVPDAMEPRGEDDRDRVRASTDSDVAQRWGLIDSVHRRPQAQRTVDTSWRQQSSPRHDFL
jgi:transposase